MQFITRWPEILKETASPLLGLPSLTKPGVLARLSLQESSRHLEKSTELKSKTYLEQGYSVPHE